LKVAIHQPQYWPWPPYIHKILSADVFVYLDTVQFSKNGLQNRNQIKTANGATWLTLPVVQHLGQTIAETQIAETKALQKHFKTLATNYARTPGFERWREDLAAMLAPEVSLCEVAIKSTEWMLSKLDVTARRVRASSLSGIEGQRSELVASICRSLGATSYLSGAGALEYMVPEHFKQIGCAITIQSWRPFEYSQAHPEIGFTRDLSTLDLLLNCPDTASALIREAGAWRSHDPQ
jgi:hypothetical protein